MSSTLANLVVKITGNTGDLQDALDDAEGRSSRFAKNASSAIQGFGKIAGAALLGAGAAVSGLGLVAGKMAMDFDKAFAEVKTLIPDADELGLDTLKQGVLDLSKEFNVAATDAVPALYQAISAGVPADNVLEFMETAAKAAVGGVTDLETAVDGITSVVNAYGDAALSAEETANVMFTGVRLGKTTFEELSSSLFNVIPTAASLGVSFEEVTAALATMTAQGVPTSVATTQLRQAFVEISKEGTKLDKSLRELTGKGFTGLIEDGKGAAEIFEDLRSSMPDDDFRNLFGSVEAMNAALQITGPNAEAMASALDEMGNSAGAVDAAFNTISETAGFKLEKAMNTIKVLMIEFGSKLLPVVADVLDSHVLPALEKFGEWFTEHRDQIGTIIGNIAEAVGVLGGAFADGIGIIMPLIKRFAEFLIDHKPILIGVVVGIGAAIATALGPVSLAAIAITGLITLLGWFKDNWETVWEGVRTFFEDKISFIVGVFDSKLGWLLPGGALIKGLLFIKENWDTIWGAIATGFGPIADGMVAVFKSAINGILSAINVLIEAWNGLDFTIPSFEAFGKSIGGFSVGTPDIPTIPMLARGTSFFGGGAAIVGEAGPELVNLPRGASVAPMSGPSVAGALGVSPVVNVEARVFIGDREIRDVVVEYANVDLGAEAMRDEQVSSG